MERIDLSSLPFLPPASKFIFDCQKKKREKKRRVGALVGCYVRCCPVYQIFSQTRGAIIRAFIMRSVRECFYFVKGHGLIIFYFMTLKSVIYGRFLFMAYLNLWISRCLTNLIFRKHEKINSPFSIVDLYLFHAR